MASQLFTLSVLAVAVQSALSFCGPEKWEGLEGVSSGNMINGTGGAGQGMLNVYNDATIQKMAIIGHVTYNGQNIKQHLLYDAGNGKRYEVYNGHCMKYDMQIPSYKINCLPPDAQKIMSSYYGAGAETFATETYHYTSFTGEDIVMTVSKNTGIPVTGHVTKTNGFADFGFMNITLGIKDMSVFDVPSECSKFQPLNLG